MRFRFLVHDFAGHPFPFGLSRALARRGHTVHHLYFAGDKGPKGRTARRADDPPGFSITGIQLNAEYRKNNFVRRRFQDIAYGRRMAREITRFAPDLVLSGNTPPDAQKIILRQCQRMDIPFIFWLQDSFGIGVERVLGGQFFGLGSLIAAHYKALENRMLRTSDAVVLITDDFRSITQAASVAPERVHVIPNWAAIEEIPVRPKDNPWAREHGLIGKFVYLYSGTLGLKHDPSLLVALAQAMRAHPEVRVVVASEGTGADWLRMQKATHELDNLLLLPFQPMERFADMLGAADVLIALIEPAAAEFSVPSKVLSYLCAKRPLLLSIPPENLAARIVARAGAGLLVEPGQADALVSAARQLHESADLRAKLGERARAYAEKHFDIGRIADRFESVFRQARERKGCGI